MPLKQRIIPFFLPNLGCGEQCCFCRQDAISGQESPPTPEQVTHWLSEHINASVDFEIAFYGGSFTSLPVALQDRYLGAAGDFIKRVGGQGGIRVSARPDRLDGETIERIKQLGVDCVEVGCQSFSDQVLLCSGRGHSASVAEEAIQRLHRAGLRVGIQLMPGLPGADRAEAHSTLDTALNLQPEFIRLYPTVVLRQTELASRFVAGEFTPLGLPEAVNLCAELCLRCEAAAVVVARVGIPLEGSLQEADAVLAGPVHSAFGQLVKSEAWYEILCPHLLERRVVCISASPEDYSDLVGHKRQMLQKIRTQVPGLDLCIDTRLAKGELLLDRKLLNRRTEVKRRFSNYD